MSFTRKKISFVLAVLFLVLISFSIGFLLSNNSWACPSCSYSSGKITPLLNEQYFETTLNQINSAENSIFIVMYEMKFYSSNNSVRKLEDALVNARARGVDVKVILDENEWYGEITDLSKENRKTAEYLSKYGVEIKFESLKTTTHNKLIILDNKIIILGSHNWSFSAMTKNNEASIMIQDEETAQYYLNYFDYMWEN